METTDFPSRLKEVRGKLGLTQKEIAEKLGCSRASYAYYETDKNTPDINFIKALHDLSGFPFEYLLGYTDNNTAETAGLDKTLGLSADAVQALKEDETIRKTINRFLENENAHDAAFMLTLFNSSSAHQIRLIEGNAGEYAILDSKKAGTVDLMIATDYIKNIFRAKTKEDAYAPPISEEAAMAYAKSTKDTDK